MEDTLLEAAKQVPALLVLAFIVRWFLAHLKYRDEQLALIVNKILDNEHKPD